MEDLDDASILLVDPGHPGVLDLLRVAAKSNKVVLHYSWVDESLLAECPLVESSNWGNCRVTLDNLNSNFDSVLPSARSNLQLQTPPRMSEYRSYSFPTPSRFSQDSTGITPPASQPPRILAPSHRNHGPVMQTPQLSLTNQAAPYNSQPMQSLNMFSPSPVSRSTDMGGVVYGQQQPWSQFRPRTSGVVQPPTLEDLRRAYEVMVWFHRLATSRRLPPPPVPTQLGPAFQPPPPPQIRSLPSVAGTHSEVPRVPGIPVTATLSRQDSTTSNGILLGMNDPPGSQPETSVLPTSSQIKPLTILLPPRQYNPAGPSMILTPPHTHPKLFEHAVGKPIMFFVPIILKERGRIAEIFRVSFRLR